MYKEGVELPAKVRQRMVSKRSCVRIHKGMLTNLNVVKIRIYLPRKRGNFVKLINIKFDVFQQL